MGYGFAFVVIALGASLLYKGYRSWSWAQFYAAVLQRGGGTPAVAMAGNAGQVSRNVKAG